MVKAAWYVTLVDTAAAGGFEVTVVIGGAVVATFCRKVTEVSDVLGNGSVGFRVKDALWREATAMVVDDVVACSRSSEESWSP